MLSQNKKVGDSYIPRKPRPTSVSTHVDVPCAAGGGASPSGSAARAETRTRPLYAHIGSVARGLDA